MARRSRSTSLKKHDFANKLLLNQWLISLFGIVFGMDVLYVAPRGTIITVR